MVKRRRSSISPYPSAAGTDGEQRRCAGDLNGDGHLDIFVGAEEAGRAWFNDGTGNFTKSDQIIEYGRYDGVTFGDVAGDGLLDVFIAGVATYQVWRGEENDRFIAEGIVDYR